MIANLEPVCHAQHTRPEFSSQVFGEADLRFIVGAYVCTDNHMGAALDQ